MKVLQINTTLSASAPGRIAEEIGQVLISKGHSSYFGYGRKVRESVSETIRIGSFIDQTVHGIKTRLLDRHGFGSRQATMRFISQVERISPDIIHLHNIHGYFLNIKVLFDFLRCSGKPVVWTLHDCWPFTGHCSHFDLVGCNKWKDQCFECPNKDSYPRSIWLDNSRQNYNEKKKLFSGLDNLVLVTPSVWLSDILKESFLAGYNVSVINNGIDLKTFQIDNGLMQTQGFGVEEDDILILGVANIWGKHKGLDDFLKLSKTLEAKEKILLIGLSKKQRRHLPSNIIGLSRTENQKELAMLYSRANVFVNPTYVDNFPTTNLEALACGTPVVTYKTGGSPEALDEHTGRIVEKGSITELKAALRSVIEAGKDSFSSQCRKRAELLYNKYDRFGDYINLYKQILEKK
jgi:glycosyltransferase involved in cell wall biosynthesis